MMTYAYRGVDLVVAIMGILKAGAAFSVIVSMVEIGGVRHS